MPIPEEARLHPRGELRGKWRELVGGTHRLSPKEFVGVLPNARVPFLNGLHRERQGAFLRASSAASYEKRK